MPNLVMISIDDLNDWTSILKGYPGTIHTPNFDRLASRGVTFANAFTPLPICNGSRAATMSGMSPLTTGVFDNEQPMFEAIDPGFTLPAVLRKAGFETVTAGKIFHQLPDDIANVLFDRVLIGNQRGTDFNAADVVPTGTTWGTANDSSGNGGGIFVGDPSTLVDSVVADRVEQFLSEYTPATDKSGLFLSVGIKHPHSPLIAPQEFFDLYPLDKIVLPDVPIDELIDIPAIARTPQYEESFARIVAAGDWRALVQAYLASISYMDHILGRLLDSIEESSIADDTMVLLWSDNGFHLGEKSRIGKFTLWDESTRISMMIGEPKAMAGSIESQVVSLLDVFPTVLDFLGVARPAWIEGESLLNLTRTGDNEGLSGTSFSVQDGRYMVRTYEFSYIRYEDGSEELYDMAADPAQHINLALAPGQEATLAALSRILDAHLASHQVVQNNTAVPRILQAYEGGTTYTGFDADTVLGGVGDNRYVVRASSVQIIEAPSNGRDVIQVVGDYTLPANVEVLHRKSFFSQQRFRQDANLIGNDLDNAMTSDVGRNRVEGLSGDDTLTGANGGDDTILGGQGDDVVRGRAGHDVLVGGPGSDKINGGTGDDLLVGEDGNDLLDGFSGADSLRGGGGNDMYLVQDVRAQVVEAPGEGRDTVSASVSYSLADGNEVEVLILAGPLATYASGNEFANTIKGSSGPNSLAGGVGDDTLIGNAGDDTTEGGAGDDRLDGGPGADQMIGGPGDDTYLVDHAADVIVEAARQGNGQDTAEGTVSYIMPIGLEALLLRGPSDLAGTGNAAANLIQGGLGANFLRGLSGADTLNGGGGADTLVGGAGADLLDGGVGADLFRYQTAAHGDDTILGYDATNDTVVVSAQGFGNGLAVGMDLVATGRYVENATGRATEFFLQFVFDRTTNTLWCDLDGMGADAPHLLATFVNLRSWSGSEITVLA